MKFHNIGYAIKTYISRYLGWTKVGALKSAWHILSRGKDACTSLKNSQQLQTWYVKVRGEGKSMRHCCNGKHLSKAGAQGSYEWWMMKLEMLSKDSSWCVFSTIPGDLALILKITSSLWRKVTFFWLTYTCALHPLWNNAIPPWCTLCPCYRGKKMYPSEGQPCP